MVMRQQQEREEQLARLLDAPQLDSYALKHACLRGSFPDRLRPDIWRHLLGLVDLGADDRSQSKANKRAQYVGLAEELLKAAAVRDLPEPGQRRAPPDVYLDDIDKDVRRTQTSYAFFSRQNLNGPFAGVPHRRALFERLNCLHPHRQEEVSDRYSSNGSVSGSAPSTPAMSSGRSAGNSSDVTANTSPASKRQDDNDDSNNQERESADCAVDADTHFECLIRLLYTFALLNPVHYVQGMSELVAPLYYVFSHSDEAEHAEADTFWAFSTLMGEFGDFYVQDSDGSLLEQSHSRPSRDVPEVVGDAVQGESRTGLGSTLRRYARQLHWLDKELAYDLHSHKEVQPTFYALRWITCLFALEFLMPDLIQIWDSIFAMLAETASAAVSKHRADSEARAFLLDICCAMVLLKRSDLLEAEFATCLQLLQSYACDDVHILMTLAFNIRERRVLTSLEGVQPYEYDSVPSSPAIANDDAQTSKATGLKAAKDLFAAAAESSTAKTWTKRFWWGKESAPSIPEDQSSADTQFSPRTKHGSPRTETMSPLLSSLRKSVNASAAALPDLATPSPSKRFSSSLPASASSILNRYASNISESDAVASLSKATTNSYIQALQWKESAPTALSQLSSELAVKVNEAAGAAKTVIRPPSPTMDPPFTPPTSSSSSTHNDRLLSPDGPGSGSGTHSALSERRPSSGPKPLLLSNAARRASGASLSIDGSPTVSRRTSSVGGQQTLPNGLGNTSLSLGLGQPLDGHASPIRSRTPSPTISTRALPHSRTASAVNFGSYKFGSGTRSNGQSSSSPASNNNANGSKVEHGRWQSTSQATPATKPKSLDSIAPEVIDNPAVLPTTSSPHGRIGSIDTSMGRMDISKRPLGSGASARLRQQRGASTDVEVLSDSAGSPIDLVTSAQSTNSTNSLESILEQQRDTVVYPKLSQSTALQDASIAEDVPLSPSARLARRKVRTTSLASSTSQSAEDGQQQNAVEKPRRKLASSRRVTRNGSIGGASVRSSDSHSGAEV